MTSFEQDILNERCHGNLPISIRIPIMAITLFYSLSRRRFIRLSLTSLVVSTFAFLGGYIMNGRNIRHHKSGTVKSELFIAKNGSPQENVRKAVEMMGGISKFINENDIVILKPNCQWWNQGRTNLAAMKGFIDLVLGIPEFKGEIIIAENHHYMDKSLPEEQRDNIRGWTHISEINGDIEGVQHSMNSLVEEYQKNGFRNVSKVYLRDGGPRANDDRHGQDGGIVRSPAEGDGYVWTGLDYVFSAWFGLRRWKVKTTYPIFTSPYSGIVIDFKNGAYSRDNAGGGKYLPEKHIKFINFAALNNHTDTGITSSIKNYMGITDLSCGDRGTEPKGYFNVHECGGESFKFAKAGPIAFFMRNIRKADMNIVTAEWVGWAHRTDITKATRMRTILAGTDPVALDYYGAKHLVYKLSGNKGHHDPDNLNSPIRKFLDLALETLGEGTIDETMMTINTVDFENRNS